MIKGKIKINSKNPEEISKSVGPDNLCNLHTWAEEDAVVTEFEFNELNTAISTLDDLLESTKLAKKVVSKWK
ncbi:MAG: Subunit of KEOPS complex, Pcc1 subunit [Candidatus Methanohalarchaeum thermophilum]|uniref:Subunit of KEOPS complex, Pcc1 subunit n=1 Tax=Methanohalarchaeum thermophilum TaxID=1903181 RepID=A0A1Q6DV62_METT1|nr:MAG: Subunit of KEOPS complex, Pcc1 subunit [Candidatus Methanohalarchaeum thermophilum]